MVLKLVFMSKCGAGRNFSKKHFQLQKKLLATPKSKVVTSRLILNQEIHCKYTTFNKKNKFLSRFYVFFVFMKNAKFKLSKQITTQFTFEVTSKLRFLKTKTDFNKY